MNITAYCSYDPNGLGQGRIYSDDSTCDNVGSPEYEKMDALNLKII